jgi:hypothetical protein
MRLDMKYLSVIISFLLTVLFIGTASADINNIEVNFVPIKITKGKNELTLYVSSDYLKQKDDSDSEYRISVGSKQAFTIARYFDSILPTTKLTNIIYNASDLKLDPKPMKPGPQMTSLSYIKEHSRIIDRQIDGKKFEIVSGHKKDIVFSKRGIQKPDRIAIYGWHRGENDVIQPLSTIHGSSYADYSHGVRLIKNECQLNGQKCLVTNILNSPDLSSIITNEGHFLNAEDSFKKLSK